MIQASKGHLHSRIGEFWVLVSTYGSWVFYFSLIHRAIRFIGKPKLRLPSWSSSLLSFRTLFQRRCSSRSLEEFTWRCRWSKYISVLLSFLSVSSVVGVGDDYLCHVRPKQCSFLVIKQFILQIRFLIMVSSLLCSQSVVFFLFYSLWFFFVLFFFLFVFFVFWLKLWSLLVVSSLQSALSF